MPELNSPRLTVPDRRRERPARPWRHERRERPVSPTEAVLSRAELRDLVEEMLG